MPPKRLPKEEIQVSLLPGERSATPEGSPRVRRGMFLAVLLLLLSIVGVSVYLQLRARTLKASAASFTVALEELTRQVDTLEGRIKAVGDVGRMISLAKGALVSHQASERMLEILETTTIPEVRVDQLAADAKGTLVLALQAKDYQAVTRQLLAWQAASQIDGAHVSGVAVRVDSVGNVEGVDFNATLTLKPGVLQWGQ